MASVVLLFSPSSIDCVTVWRIEPSNRWLPSLVFGVCVCQALCIGSDAWPARGIQSRPDSDRWWNWNRYRTLHPWGDISRRRRRLLIEEVNGRRSSLPHSPTPVEVVERRLTHQRPFARCRLPSPNLKPLLRRIAIFAWRRARSSTMHRTTLSCSHGTSVRLLRTQRARRPPLIVVPIV